MVKELEDFMIVYDSLGVCKFSRKFFWLEGFPDILEACFGWKPSESELLKIGEKVSNLKQLFNLKAGWKREEGFLPLRLRREPISEGVSKGAIISDEDMNTLLDDYYTARGWSRDGVPNNQKLAELGIESR
jgi:aldehyde:ferredoxin oxidoreductase